MFKKLGRAARWLRSNPFITLAGVLGTVFGLIVAAYNFANVGLALVGLPSCLTYADVYRHATGYFQKDGEKWIEHPPFDGRRHFTFRETHRDRDYIYLLNETPRAGPQNTMLLRLPTCGGEAQWSYQNPQQWTNLYQIWR